MVQGFIDLGCDRIAQMMVYLGRPDISLNSFGTRIIHVTGTNGKGSCCYMLASAIHMGGKSVGTFTSPHVRHPADSINFANPSSMSFKSLSAKQYTSLRAALCSRCSFSHVLTEFELLTSVAVVFFSYFKPKFLVVEVGMGGRLDATNLLTCVKDCLITNVSLDHTDFLGETLSEICAHKAGILSPGSRLFAPTSLSIGCHAILRMESKLKLSSWIYWVDVSVSGCSNTFVCDIDELPISTSLSANHQLSNAKLSHAICRKQCERIPFGQSSWLLPGRLQRFSLFGTTLILDGAHNEAGLVSLVEYVTAHVLYPVFWIIAFSGNKGHLLDRFRFSSEDVICFTQFRPVETMPWVKVAPNSILRTRLAQMYPELYICDAESVQQALRVAGEHRTDMTIVIAGSLYLVSDFLSTNHSVYSPVSVFPFHPCPYRDSILRTPS